LERLQFHCFSAVDLDPRALGARAGSVGLGLTWSPR